MHSGEALPSVAAVRVMRSLTMQICDMVTFIHEATDSAFTHISSVSAQYLDRCIARLIALLAFLLATSSQYALPSAAEFCISTGHHALSGCC